MLKPLFRWCSLDPKVVCLRAQEIRFRALYRPLTRVFTLLKVWSQVLLVYQSKVFSSFLRVLAALLQAGVGSRVFLYLQVLYFLKLRRPASLFNFY